MLWDGKRIDEVTSKRIEEITSETNLDEPSIQEGFGCVGSATFIRSETNLDPISPASMISAGMATLRRSETNLDKLSIQEGERERELVADMASEGKQISGGFAGTPWIRLHLGSNSVEERLIKKIKAFPLQKVEEPATRIQAATTLLKELLEEKKSEFPSVPKLMLFELMLVAFSSGTVSDIELALLKEFQHHYQLENFIFDDLLERAETMTKEVSKTISIILE